MSNPIHRVLIKVYAVGTKACLALVVLAIFASTTGSAQEKSDDEWQYGLEVYFWLPNLYVSTDHGNVTLSLKDIITNLRWMTMLDVDARKGKISMGLDVIYMHLAGSKEGNLRIPPDEPLGKDARVDLKALIPTFHGGYEVYSKGDVSMDAIIGVRYLGIKVPIKITVGEMTRRAQPKGHNWDGIVGFNTRKLIDDKSYVDFYGDIGAGQSDLTWQAKLGFGYQLSKFEATFGLRYMRWNFKKSANLENLRILGPYVGAKWYF